jgi:hypothetical protein
MKKLFEVKHNSRISVDGLAINDKPVREFNFHHVDGMYSYCTTDDGDVFHLLATTECTIIREGNNENIV